MFIGKRYPFWGLISWSKKYILIFLILDIIPVILFKTFNWQFLLIPWQPISLIGIAVSFYLGFKNNSSYDRLWEARKIWGEIVNGSRTFTVMARDFVTNEFANKKASEEEINSIHKSIVHRHIAWLKALTYQLRQPREWEHSRVNEIELRKEGNVHHSENHFEKLKPYLATEEYNYLMTKGNKASHLLSLQSKEFRKLKSSEFIDDFRHMQLENMIGEFFTYQGKSERIKNFPFPRQYATVNYLFVWLFLILLPFGMLNIFHDAIHIDYTWLVFPFSVLVSWVFILMELIGDYSENPFEGLHNDVPISTIARDIEIDIRQMLDETDLPEPVEPVGPYRIVL